MASARLLLLSLWGCGAQGLRQRGPAEYVLGLDEWRADATPEAMPRTAADRLAAAWHFANCSATAKVPLGTQLLQPPVTPYSPWVSNVPVFYITTGGQREHLFLSSLGNFSHSYTRVPAMNGSDFGVLQEVLHDWRLVTMGYGLKFDDAGKRLGCLLSHLKLIKAAYNSGAEVVLVLEDDAVPLYSGWQMALEEYMAQLPEDWEATQLHWTKGEVKTPQLEKEEKGAYQKGSGWGTAAYLLHRRAMTRIVNLTWDTKHKKFNITTMLQHCKAMSADDCLLSFSPHGQNRWLEGRRRTLDNVYKATPPLFAHLSVSSSLHKKNLCANMMNAQGIGLTPESGKLRKPAADRAEVLVYLVFPSYEESKEGREAVLRQNMKALHRMGLLKVNLFLDMTSGTFQDTPPPHLQLSSSGRMLQLMGQTWRRYRSYWKQKYNYIWALDSDISVESPELIRDMLHLAQESKALVTSPAVRTRPEERGDGVGLQELPRTDCRYRYARRVSPSAALMKTFTWGSIFEECNACIDRNSEYVDTGRWCNFFTKAGNRSCAILDDTPVKRAAHGNSTDESRVELLAKLGRISEDKGECITGRWNH